MASLFRRVSRAIPAAVSLIILAIAAALPAVAQVPRTLTFSGVLANATGVPKANGSYNLTFRLFDVATGGTALWTEANRPVTVSGGRGAFTTVLGAPTPFGSLAFDKPYYLEVQVQGEASPMSPRLALTAAPYTLSASGNANLTLPSAGSANVPTPGAVLKVTNTGNGLGIVSEAPAHIGVQGISDTWVGVWGKSRASTGVHGESDVWVGTAGISNTGAGVYGKSTSWAGVWGDSTNSAGVVGKSENWEGIHGESVKEKGVFGGSTSWVGVWGQSQTSTGVFGDSASGVGVHGRSKGSSGVFGESLKDDAGFSGSGVHGVSHYLGRGGVLGENDFAGGGVGVIGSGIGGFTVGVRGTSGAGAVGELGTYDQDGRGIGVMARAPISGGAGLYASANPGIPAGIFSGRVVVNGPLEVYGAKNFRIDHPLDPANKTLTHACAEGPEALNIYSGTVRTGPDGTAVVQLPEYFEALNRDFRYQLTVVEDEDSGDFIRAKVSRKVRNNEFSIRTDHPNVEVSWQVTGVRNDAYMRMHPQPVEEMKPADQRGRYLDPESHGQPREKGIGPIIPDLARVIDR